ncbi:histidine kinase dimerization/phosphoacceptor domain -containing protein [Herpetosiphon geysericola]|uniref:histidine kinase n=1 Tax=Herpetosiphon geysericola TaxID=70996 RepID=A0A0P6YHM1_9CHLR|nr:histidine kinase dimerization/phosphoacceptor domain -containing protein [Herpetosiphon geysericola]KPL88975.1 hypothetical protein SE18_09985 [Herpetosiphon geysericola]
MGFLQQSDSNPLPTLPIEQQATAWNNALTQFVSWIANESLACESLVSYFKPWLSNLTSWLLFLPTDPKTLLQSFVIGQHELYQVVPQSIRLAWLETHYFNAAHALQTPQRLANPAEAGLLLPPSTAPIWLIPLQAYGRLWGIVLLEVAEASPPRQHPLYTMLAQAIANLSLHLDARYAREYEVQAYQRMHMMSASSHILAHTGLNLDRMLLALSKHLCEHFSDGCMLQILSMGETSHIQQEMFYHQQADYRTQLYRMSAEWANHLAADSLRNQVLISNQALALNIYEHQTILQASEFQSLLGTYQLNSVLIVGLYWNDHPVGVLTLLRTHINLPFMQEDLDIARDIGTRFVEALEQTRLYTELHEQEQALMLMVRRLEEQVEERTNALSTTNVQLNRELDRRRNTEKALVESQALLRSFYESTPVMMGVVEITPEADLVLLAANTMTIKQWCLAANYCEMTMSELGIPRSDIDRWIQFFQRSRTKGQPEHFDYADPFDSTIMYKATLSPVVTSSPIDQRFCFVLDDITESRNLQQSLEESKRLVEQINNSIPCIVYMYDVRINQVTYINRSLSSMLGYEIDEMVGMEEMDLRSLIHPDDLIEIDAYLPSLYNSKPGTIIQNRFRIKHRDGQWHWIVSYDTVFESDETGYATSVLSALQDVTELYLHREQLQASLQEKMVLLQEIHHRVKNNLQIVSSLLNLQARQISDVSTRDRFLESQSRIHAMALVHEQLYRSSDLRSIDLAEYIKHLVQFFRRSHTNRPTISVQVMLEPITLNTDTTIQIGLIINELLTNSFKHAFIARASGTIWLKGTSNQQHVELEIGDDGIGLPADRATSNSMGLELVYALIRQLGATIQQLSTSGTVFKLTIPYK